MQAESLQPIDPRQLLESARQHKSKNEWEPIAAMAEQLPVEPEGIWLELTDEVGFALGALARTEQAAQLFERAFSVCPTYRRASAMAYLYYDRLLRYRTRPAAKLPFDRESDKAAFHRWIVEAFRHRPNTIKDTYRLGVYYAQIESRKDVLALRTFRRAIDTWLAMPADQRKRLAHLRKPYVRSLYGAARSALRLEQVNLARRLAFACIREDQGTNHMEPLFKLYLAGRACLAAGETEHAERAFRLALDAARKGQDRSFVFLALARLCLADGRPREAVAWIDEHVPAHRRSPVLWRTLGEALNACGRSQRAEKALRNALRRDRGGRHLTLTSLGQLHLAAGDLKAAERDFRQALAFRNTRYHSEHIPALEGLALVLERRDRADALAEVRARLDELRRRDQGRHRSTRSSRPLRGPQPPHPADQPAPAP